jgi:hypothetical protein
MDWSDKTEIYRGGKPRELPLWQLFDNHLDDFEYRYDDLFSREYGRSNISEYSNEPSACRLQIKRKVLW